MPRPGKQTTERAKDFKGTLRQLLSALRQYKLSLIVVMVFAILSTIFNIAGPKILAKATTALATGWIAKLRGIGSIDFAYIGKILLILLAMYLCSAAFSFIQGWLMTGLSQKVCYDFRRQISEKINRLPLAYFEKRTVGEVLSRITNDVDTLGQSLNQSVTQLITSITTMIGVLIMMPQNDPDCTAHPARLSGPGDAGGQVQPEILQGPAGYSGRCERSGGGGLLRPQCHQGLQP